LHHGLPTAREAGSGGATDGEGGEVALGAACSEGGEVGAGRPEAREEGSGPAGQPTGGKGGGVGPGPADGEGGGVGAWPTGGEARGVGRVQFFSNPVASLYIGNIQLTSSTSAHWGSQARLGLIVTTQLN
jgi:hypothetical protein